MLGSYFLGVRPGLALVSHPPTFVCPVAVSAAPPAPRFVRNILGISNLCDTMMSSLGGWSGSCEL